MVEATQGKATQGNATQRNATQRKVKQARAFRGPDVLDIFLLGVLLHPMEKNLNLYMYHMQQPARNPELSGELTNLNELRQTAVIPGGEDHTYELQGQQ